MRLDGRVGLLLVAVAVAGSLAGLVTGALAGPLWLDEALSVEIARLPVPDLLAALRRDGSPPLYYLLLHAWLGVVGDGTVAVRVPTIALSLVALALAGLAGRRVGGVAGGRAAVVALATLPWFVRYGSEARMYLLVVVLVLAGALALLAVRRSASWGPVLGLAAATGALLLTHYWAFFLLAPVGLWLLVVAVRGTGWARRAVAGLVAGGLLFLPQLPTFLFQAARTGAPWADPPVWTEVLRTPRYWGGGSDLARTAFAVLLVGLVVVAVARGPRVARPAAAVAVAALLLAFGSVLVGGGAYTGRYTAVVVPLVAVSAGLGAVALGRGGLPALALLAAVGLVTGVTAVQAPRASADRIADAFRGAASPGDVLVYCPDQLGPPVAREIGPGYEQVVYPTLSPPQLVDWVDYAERNEAASPVQVAAAVDALAGDRPLFVLKASGYRTFEGPGGASDRGDDCDALLASVAALRGGGEHLLGELGTTGQLLFRFAP